MMGLSNLVLVAIFPFLGFLVDDPKASTLLPEIIGASIGIYPILYRISLGLTFRYLKINKKDNALYCQLLPLLSIPIVIVVSIVGLLAGI